MFPILGIETSGNLCSVAVMLNEHSYFELNIHEKHIHSKKLIGMIDIVLKESSVSLTKIKLIAVSIGPGSFTGLRIGLTAAKGIGFGANLPIAPVPTFDALALHISSFTKNDSEFQIIRKASIEDYYFAKYSYHGRVVKNLTEVNLINKTELKNNLNPQYLIYGDKIDSFEINSIEGPTALMICRYSNLFGKDLLTFDYDYLEPFYLKKFIAKVKK
jgi:tRNA threonylcarbamoyladenosine biosynthesis protein TsaB